MPKEERMLPGDLRERLQKHRREIKQTWDSLSSVYEQFVEEEIYPEHCDEMRNALRKMRVPVNRLQRLLDTPSHLPLTLVPHSFSPSITLRQVDELTDELTILILLFRKICSPLSQNVDVHQREILYKLHALIQGYEDILQHIDRLLLQVLAQERAERQELKARVYHS